jgi:hypothetical protein
MIWLYGGCGGAHRVLRGFLVDPIPDSKTSERPRQGALTLHPVKGPVIGGFNWCWEPERCTDPPRRCESGEGGSRGCECLVLRWLISGAQL